MSAVFICKWTLSHYGDDDDDDNTKQQADISTTEYYTIQQICKCVNLTINSNVTSFRHNAPMITASELSGFSADHSV